MSGPLHDLLNGPDVHWDPATDRVRHFGDAEAELGAALATCALAERSELTRLIATGPDYLTLLHRLSTGDVASLAEGDGRPTVLTTAKGRIVERLFVHHLGVAGVLSVGGAGSAERVAGHLARYTFAERTELEDAASSTFFFEIVGPRAADALRTAGAQPPERHRSRGATIGGCAVHILGEDGHGGDGLSVVGAIGAAVEVWSLLREAVADAEGRPAGEESLEAWRILRGLPASGRELNEDHNPLEADLWDAVSFDKGCYVGQEVVARLRTYDKISRSIVGLRWPCKRPLPQPGTALFDDDRPVGELTSATELPGRPYAAALAYVKRKALRPGLSLRLGDGDEITAEVVDLPFPV